jgi:hypothetical protein
MKAREYAVALLLLCALGFGQSARSGRQDPNAESMQRKLQAIQQNAAARKPATTILTEAEINAWFASSYAQLPKGVHTLKISGDNGQVTGSAQVNFDEVKEGRSSNNPLMMLFGGTHDVQVVATGQATNGEATVHVQSVSLDGIEVPRTALEFFVDRYIKPKYPNVGLDSTFRPGYRIDSATVGAHQLTIVQK